MKWDGHTHSQFCRHGSGEETALMVEKAIQLGFERYSIVEHAPLPDGIIDDPEVRLDFGLSMAEMDDYLHHLQELKKTYGNRIQILSGLEIDFFQGLESFAADMINTYSERLDDAILSLHFIRGRDGFKPLDYRADVFDDELIGYYGSIDMVQEAYWETVDTMVDTKLELPGARRLGHLGLINKFSGLFEKRSQKYDSIPFFEALFRKIKSKGWALDFNVAGLNQKWYQDLYLTEPMRYWTKELNIATVFGSDAHSVDAVGQHYDAYLNYRQSQ